MAEQHKLELCCLIKETIDFPRRCQEILRENAPSLLAGLAGTAGTLVFNTTDDLQRPAKYAKPI
jgi:hypothetical protein